MNPSRLALTAAALVLVTACGGSDEPVAAPAVEAPADDSDDTEATPAAASATTVANPFTEGPDATIAPDIPDTLRDVVGPIEVQGDSLVPLVVDDIVSDEARGDAAPVVIGLDFDGDAVRIDAGEQGPTMVVFLAHWCPHCNDEIPQINALRDSDRFPDDLNVVGVSTGVNPTRPNFPPDRWLTSMDWTYPVIIDGVDMDREALIAADAFGVTGFPFIALIDGDGVVQARWSGASPQDEIIRRIEANLTFE